MRVIHFADLHIGVENYGRPLQDKPWSSRMQDFLDAFDELVDFAIDSMVDAVIFAGDAYKSREPTQTQQREFARRIQRLSQAEVPTFLLVGNHDLPNSPARAHALEIFRTLDVPHVYVGDTHWFDANGLRPVRLETRSGPLQVAFVPWPQVSRLLASDDDLAAMTIDQVNARVEDQISALVEAQANALSPDIPAILTAHISVNDFLVRENQGSERWMMTGTAPTLLKSALHADRFDYVALGHHHNPIDLELDTPAWYSGAMQPVDFGEEDQRKGFIEVTLDETRSDRARVTYHDVTCRRFVTVDAKPSDLDPTPEVRDAIDAAGVADAIVRVRISLSREQEGQLRLPEVRRALESAHYVQSIRPILPDDQRRKLPPSEQPDAAAPLESLETYFKSRELPDERRRKLLAAAGDLMREHEELHA